MTYYLLLDGDSERDTLYDTNVLGEESFGTFYVSMGFSLLQKILNDKKVKEFYESTKQFTSAHECCKIQEGR